MGTDECIFNEPLGEEVVESDAIDRHDSHRNKLLLDGFVESFIDRIVGGCVRPRPVIPESKLGNGLLKFLLKLAAVVMAGVPQFIVHEVGHPIDEVLGVSGGF